MGVHEKKKKKEEEEEEIKVHLGPVSMLITGRTQWKRGRVI